MFTPLPAGCGVFVCLNDSTQTCSRIIVFALNPVSNPPDEDIRRLDVVRISTRIALFVSVLL